MIWRARTHIFLLTLLVLLGAKLGEQVYRWFAFADEREKLRALTTQLDSAGLAVLRTQLQADSLRLGVHAMDRDLEEARRALAGYEGEARGGALPYHLYDGYRAAVDAYNRLVSARNTRFERWREVVARNHRAVHRYNALADTIRGVARQMGELYFEIPTPAEVAARHGLGAPGAAGRSVAPGGGSP